MANRVSSFGVLAAVALGCAGNEPDPTGGQLVGEDKIVACACTAQGTVRGTIDGRTFDGVATGLIKPDVGDLSITLYETGGAPTCHESGNVKVSGGGTLVRIALCLPASGELTVGNAGGPVGTHCSERPGNAAVLIADPGEQGTLMNGGKVTIHSADGRCVSGSVTASLMRVAGSRTIMETLSGTFTVPNASCFRGWTGAVTKYCP
jgi:hypothetical protein